MSFTSDFIERVRSATDIVDLIGQKIQLIHKGSNITALCPFHKDTRPSLTISREKQIYKCFSCGAGGDVFRFLMDFDRKSFPEACKELAHLHGIPVPSSSKFYEQDNPIDQELQPKAIHSFVSSIYHQYLLKHKGGKLGRDYLRKRKLDRKMIDAFQVGYAPDQWDFLTSILSKRYPTKAILRTGLVSQSKTSNKLYDAFRGRIMFPILNQKREVVGFGGRAISSKETAKYINSRELPFFQKKNLLYGLAESYTQIINEAHVYVVEGYLDVIACHANDLAAVAPLGTALTREQVKQLTRFVKKVTVVFDGDTAGLLASQKASIQLLQGNLIATVVCLPAHKDPYDFLQQNGLTSFIKYLKQHQTSAENTIIQSVLPPQENQTTYGSLSASEKRSIARSFLQQITPITDSLIRTEMFTKTAQLLQVDPSFFNTSTLNPRPRFLPIKSSSQDSLSPQVQKERQLIEFLCEYPSFISKAFTVIHPKTIIDPFSKKIYTKLLQIKDKTISFSGVLEFLNDQKTVDLLTHKLLQKERLSGSADPNMSNEEREKWRENLFADYLYAVRKTQIEKAIQSTSKDISTYHIENNAQKLTEAMEEKARLIHERTQLQHYIADEGIED